MSALNIAFAASESVVNCSGLGCGFCSFLESLSSIYNIILSLAFAVAVLIAILAGFSYFFDMGKNSYLKMSKKMLLGATIGFVFILLGWILIHGFFAVLNYKNQGSWWQFKCENDSEKMEPLDAKSSPKAYNQSNKITTYLTLSQYLESNDKIAEISGPLAASLFMKQLQDLKEGESLRFLAPALETFSNGNKEVYAPLITVSKENGQIKINDVGNTLNKYLAPALEKIEASIPYSSGSIMNAANQDIPTDTNALLAEFNNVFLTNSKGGVQDVLDNPFESKDLVDVLTQMVKEDTVNKAKNIYNSDVAGLIEQSLNSTDDPAKTNALIGEILNKGILEEGSSLLVVRNSGLPSVSELSQLLSKNDVTNGSLAKEKTNNESDNSNSKEEKDSAKKETANANSNPNQNNVQKPVYPPTQDINNPPTGSLTDKSDGLIDKTDRKPPPDSLDKDDWLPGDGTPEAIKKALRRIEKRDPLRYEMVFRYVEHIGDMRGGGLCTGCGNIYVDHTLKIYDISHVLIHEATHSGHDCTVGWGAYSMSQIEAIACANQMGSIKRSKISGNDKENKADKIDDVDNMREFPRQSKEILYKSIPVRGFLCRYLDKVTPKGDLGTWILKMPRDYAVITHKYANVGPYVYGDPEDGITLNLAKSEEFVVQRVMTGRDKCKSSPPKDLPPVKECEGAPEIKID